MFFLIDYHRSSGRLLRLEPFASADRSRADDARLNLELALNAEGGDREIVVLEADSERALRRTHRRYFEDLAELASSLAGELK